MIAVLRGLASVGDPDELVERTFSNVNVADRSHTYWEMYRGLSDAGGQVDQQLVTRLVGFWEWRLSQLEASEDISVRKSEAAGLTWVLATPQIPAADAVRLGLRTVILADDELDHQARLLWGRIAELSVSDAKGTFEIAERLVNHMLTRPHPYLPFESVGPVLARAMKSDDAQIKKRAEHLINALGDRGYYNYGKLLD